VVGFVRLRDLNDTWFSVSVGFVLLQDFKDGRVCSVRRAQWWLVLFSYKLSMTSVLLVYKISKTVGFVLLWDFNDGRFCSVTRFQWRLVFSVSWFCSVTRFQRWTGLFGYEISMTVSFIQLQAFDDICFIRLRKFKDRRFFFFRYEISKTVGFVLLWDFNDDQFCSVTRSQWRLVLQCQLVLFRYKTSKMVGFVWLRDLNDG